MFKKLFTKFGKFLDETFGFEEETVLAKESANSLDSKSTMLPNEIAILSEMKKSASAYYTNPLYSRIVDGFADGILGRELKIEAIDENQQKIINNFLNINNFSKTSFDLVLQLVLKGEVLLEFQKLETGYLVLTNIYSNEIVSIKKQGLFIVEAEIELDDSNFGETKKVEIIYNPAEQINSIKNGDKVYFYLYLTTFKGRGIPIAYRSYEWAKKEADLVRHFYEFVRNYGFFIDISVENASEDIINDLKTIEANKIKDPFAVRIHDTSINYTYQSPNVKVDSFEFIEEKLRHAALGAAGMGAHHFAAGQDINRATAQEMREPYERFLRRIREVFKQHIKLILYTQLLLQGVNEPNFIVRATVVDNSVFQVLNPLGSLINSFESAITLGILSSEEARKLVINLLKEYDIDLEDDGTL